MCWVSSPRRASPNCLVFLHTQVVDEANRALAWLAEKTQLQAQAAKHDDPVLLSSDVRKKEDTLKRVAEPILTKPPPPLPKVSACCVQTTYVSACARQIADAAGEGATTMENGCQLYAAADLDQ